MCLMRRIGGCAESADMYWSRGYAPEQRICTVTAVTRRCSGYAPVQRLRAGAADMHRCNGYAPEQRLRAGAADMRRSSGYAPDAAEMDTGEKGIYAIAVKCELFINYADD